VINDSIFREYDIRGTAETDLDDEAVSAIGQALASVLREKGATTLALGRDVRLTSPRIAKTFSDTLISSGISIIDIGTVPTPLLYYALFTLPVSAGAMITASHNPAPDNGIKLAIGRETIHGEAISEIRKRAGSFPGISEKFQGEQGILSTYPLSKDYIQDIRSRFGRLPHFANRPLRVVVDCGNATAGLVVRDLYAGLGAEISYLFETPDGRFPNHHPDPTVPENLTALRAAVIGTGADLGIAFDGDSDRIGVLDETGTLLFGDQLMVLFSEDVLERNPGAPIISEVKASKFLYDRIAELGGKPIMWKAGHSLIKAKMKETKAPLAGEMSGHIFFADQYFGYDDALYAGVRLMALMTKRGRSLSALLSHLPRTFSTPEIRKECPDSKKFSVVENLKKIFRQKGIPFNDIDGIRAEFSDGWGLVRSSNTQPALVLRFEAGSEERMEEIRSMFLTDLSRAMAMTGIGNSLGQDADY
jgi:phosphomannomutase/phosphoglucomutase